MSKRLPRLLTTMKSWLFPNEEEPFFNQQVNSNIRNTSYRKLPNEFKAEARVINQYPQSDKGQHPIVKKGIPVLPERNRRSSSLVGDRGRKENEDNLFIEAENDTFSRGQENSQRKREIFAGKGFAAKETPSPIYAYQKPGYRKRRDEQHLQTEEQIAPLEANESIQVENQVNIQDKVTIELNDRNEEAQENDKEELVVPENSDGNLDVTTEINIGNRAERRRLLREEKKKAKRKQSNGFQTNLPKQPIVNNDREEASDSSITTEKSPYNVLMYNHDKKNENIQEKRQYEGYSFPSIHLLSAPRKQLGSDNEWMKEQVNTLNDTFDYFGIRAKVVHVTRGPSVTRFEVHPEPGVKVSKITNLTDDLKLSLAAKEIRMEAPIPGKNTIGIEVPNKVSDPVVIREVIHHEKFRQGESPLTVALGKDISGEPIITDLQKMPHGLIAGATGSGKSVCVNSIILSILYKASPEDVRLLLIDPKMVELAPYNGVPHLATPVITDPKEATEGLKWAVAEMERRYELFAAQGTRDLKRYNDKMKSLNNNDEVLPYLVVIVDELADLMMVAPHDVEEAICRIAQKARACGIHLLVATQRPSVDVITGLIKANIPTRIAFSVSSQADSRTILDGGGAEKLLGKGDMLFLENGSSKPVRIQGTFVSDDEIDRVMAEVRCEGSQDFLFEKEALKHQVESETGDELFEPACQFVSEQQTASVSMLQRYFRIGYNRAARLIDEMEEKGIISGAKGSKPRDVYLTKDEIVGK